MRTKFMLPKTATCIVVWYRDGQKHESKPIPTPGNCEQLRNVMVGHGVGYSEIRCVKADPNGKLRTVADVNPAAIRHAMMAI